jgi:cytochrome c biogenesis protein CcdA
MAPGPLYHRSTTAPTNNLAVVSLVAGVLSFFSHVVPVVGGLVVAIVAIVTGHMARQQIRQTGEKGMWIATTGMVIGIIHVALIAVVVLGLLLAIFVLGLTLFGAHR